MLLVRNGCAVEYSNTKRMIEQAMALTNNNLLHLMIAHRVVLTILKNVIENSSEVVNKPECLSGDTPLIIAIKTGYADAVELLLGCQFCNPNARNDKGDTPLIVACKMVAISKEDSELATAVGIANQLLKVPTCNPYIADAQGVTPLQIAHKASMTIFFHILEKGCEKHSKAKQVIEQAMTLTDGKLLHLNITHWRGPRIIQCIVETSDYNESIINTPEASTGHTPLATAIKAENAEAVDVLLHLQYCDPNVKTGGKGDTALIMACQMAIENPTGTLFQIIRSLLACARCDPNSQNDAGNSALHFVTAGYCREALIPIVYHEKYQPDIENKLDTTPLHIACAKVNTQAVEVILQRGGCNVNAQTATGLTPLHLVVGAKNGALEAVVDIIQLLLAVPHCDLHIADAKGVTPLQIAYKKDVQLFTLLLEKGCAKGYSKTKNMVQQAMEMTSNHLLHLMINWKGNGVIENILKSSHSFSVVNRHGPSSSDTPLVIAIKAANVEAVKLLVDCPSCNLNVRTAYDTPLIIACRLAIECQTDSCVKIVHTLLSSKKCDPSMQNNEGNTALHFAVAETFPGSILPILDHEKYKADVGNNLGETPLHMACAYLNVQAVTAILKKGNCNVNKQTTTGQTPLHLVARANHGKHESKEKVTRQLLGVPDCDPHIADTQGVTPLEVASKSYQIFTLILEKGCSGYANKHQMLIQAMNMMLNDIDLLHHMFKWEGITSAIQFMRLTNSKNTVDALVSNFNMLYKDTLLEIATQEGNSKLVDFLLVEFLHCNLNQYNGNGKAALHIATECRHVDVIQVLLNSGKCDANLPTRDNVSLFPLAIACVSGSAACVEVLAKYKDTDINKKLGDGNTSLHLASRIGHSNCIAILLSSKHCNPNLQNNDGDTPLHLAVKSKTLNCIAELTKCLRCDVNAVDRNYNTALHLAIKTARYCSSTDLSIVKCLVSNGTCDITAADFEGNTPLHLACRKGSWNTSDIVLDLVRVLLSTGKADPQCVNNAAETPAQFAISNKQLYQELSFFCEAKLKNPIQTFVKVFVVGNAETGKSTLIESICTEALAVRRYMPSPLKTVKGVKLHTAGIVPSPVHSQHFGNAIFYDFAGQHEYYSSHASVLENLILSSPPIFLLLVNLSEPFESILEITAYWWSFIRSYTARSRGTPPYVIIVGSHKDVVKARGGKVSSLTTRLRRYLDELPTNFTVTQFVTMNCKLVASDGLTALLSLLNITCEKLRKDLQIDLRCHVLSAFLQDQFPNSMACTLADITDSIKAEENTLLPQSTPDLVNLLAALNDKDRILLLKNSERLERSWIILQRQKLYGEINGSIFAPEYFDEHLTDFARSTGIVPLSKVKKHFSHHHPDIITGFLSHLEFCFKIGDAQTLDLIADEEEYSSDEEFYFFPALVEVKNPPKENVWKSEIQSPVNEKPQHKLKYGWFYECSHPHQYLMTRFLHVLLFRLAFTFALAMDHRPSHNFPAIRRRCSVWKRGIAWLNNDGIETVLEVGLQNQWVVLLMQCSTRMKVECAKLRSAVIKIILDTKEEFCPSIGMYESLLHPCNVDYPFQRTDQLCLCRLKEVSRVLIERRSCAVDERGLNLIQLTELLPFEPYTGLGEVLVTKLFTSEYAQCKIPKHSLKEISKRMLIMSGTESPVERLELLARALLPQEATPFLISQKESPVVQCVSLIKQAQIKTYQNLEDKLSSFSIFCGRNLLNLVGLPPAVISAFTHPEHEFLLEETDDGMLGIESLLEVRTEVAPAVGHSNSLGLALGLSQAPTLQVIQHSCPDDVAFQLTEIMAAWLQGMGNSSWKSLAKALLDPAVDHPVVARAIMEHHQGCSSDTSGEDIMYQEVDGAPLAETISGDIFRAVLQGCHFSWFHLGLVLGLHYGTLKAIHIDHNGHTECIAVMITKWLNQVDSVERQGHPSWRVLARALAHPLVGQRRLADDIAKDHPAQKVSGTSGNVSLSEMASLHLSESPQPLCSSSPSPTPPLTTSLPHTPTPPFSSHSSSPP